MTHTPGPWRIGDAGVTVFGPKTDRPSPLTIATLTKNDTKANARLIAAAPELLEALKLALATIERLKPAQPYDSTQGTRDVCNAAIAKAEGTEK